MHSRRFVCLGTEQERFYFFPSAFIELRLIHVMA